LVTFAVLGVLAVPTARPAQATTRANGLVSDLTWYISRADMDRSIAMMHDAGVQWIRANMNWSSVEPNAKGTLDAWWLDEIDYAVTQAQAAGIQVLMPIADGVPYWASADPKKSGGSWNKYWKPTNFADYADFAARIVSRYSAKGVHAYEVWNEPNYSRFWPSGPSPADYTNMLKAAYPAIKGADPSATVVMGGVSRNDYGFLSGMYAAGAAPYFDAAAVHPYTNQVDPTLCWNDSGTANKSIDAFCGIETVRNVMVANGDSAKNLWLTEFGWSTASGASNGVSEATQADYLTKAFAQLDSYPYVTNAFWYGFRNNYWSNNDQADVEANYGLTRVDFSLKPAYAAYKALSSTTTTPTTTPPTTTSTTVPPPTTTTTTPPPPVADTTAPLISNVVATKVTATAEKITWLTNEASNSVVEYWKTGGTVKRVSGSALVLNHSLKASSLARATTYNVRVKSTDKTGNTATSGTITFRTS
jgi:hypothetical protein